MYGVFKFGLHTGQAIWLVNTNIANMGNIKGNAGVWTILPMSYITQITGKQDKYLN